MQFVSLQICGAVTPSLGREMALVSDCTVGDLKEVRWLLQKGIVKTGLPSSSSSQSGAAATNRGSSRPEPEGARLLAATSDIYVCLMKCSCF